MTHSSKIMNEANLLLRTRRFRIKNATNLLLQTGSHITQQFSLTKPIISEISDTAFAE
jgi:hypothetical protein